MSSGSSWAPSASSQQPQAVGTTTAPLQEAGCPHRERRVGAARWAPRSQHHSRAPAASSESRRGQPQAAPHSRKALPQGLPKTVSQRGAPEPQLPGVASAFQQEAGPAGQVPCLPRARLGHHSGSRWPTLPTTQALSRWVCPLLPCLRPGLAKHGQGPPSTTPHCQPPVPTSPGLGWHPGLPTPGHGWEAAALRPPSPSSQGPGTAPSCHALPPWPPQPPATSSDPQGHQQRPH